ncbi:hypothetical protein Sjap_009221 [Stephania japonica]|uniref:Uncharacterized protein n=1 Tax=Stephania japonica TaxID=461633 RepID=A0AAP0JR31_9MAGN
MGTAFLSCFSPPFHDPNMSAQKSLQFFSNPSLYLPTSHPHFSNTQWASPKTSQLHLQPSPPHDPSSPPLQLHICSKTCPHTPLPSSSPSPSPPSPSTPPMTHHGVSHLESQ